jgi:hypothetical protein
VREAQEPGIGKTLLPDEAGARDYGVAGGFLVGDIVGYAREFLLDYAGEFGHLSFHFEHFLPHVQDDFDAGEVYAHIASQRQYYVEALQIFVGVEAGVAFGARWLQQADALVEAQCLRMQFIKFGYRTDHVAGFGAGFSSGRHFSFAGRHDVSCL